MIDKKNRKNPRFPASKEQEVKAKILMQLTEEKNTALNPLTGIAGGACGGDILFHELCDELEIHSELYLALPPAAYKRQSVSFAGKIWESRFDKLIKKHPTTILPKEIRYNKEKNIWAETNLWILGHVLKTGQSMTLIALWDGKTGDGKGGTEHMITKVQNKGGKIKIIDINKI
jgi:hypothetical protein